MRLEFISNVKENEVLGKTIFDTDGRILLKSGIKLTRKFINKLECLGVYYVYIEDDRLDDIVMEDYKLNTLKQATIKSLNKIINNVGAINRESTQSYISMVSEMIDYILEIKDINKSLFDIKTHDNYTMLHSVDTGIMAAFMGVALGLKKIELNELVIGSTLHDIGKIKVPINILDKNGPLNFEEFEEMKKHPIYGKEMLMKNMSIPTNSLKIVEQHHEKINGKGYPYGLEDKGIFYQAKITSICDVYDAISSDRSYRKKFSPSDAYELILAESGSSFDPELIQTFKRVFSVYPLGSCVKLSNDVEGYVIKQNENFPDRPVVRVLYDYKTKLPVKFYEIDLLRFPNLTIKSVI